MRVVIKNRGWKVKRERGLNWSEGRREGREWRGVAPFIFPFPIEVSLVGQRDNIDYGERVEGEESGERGEGTEREKKGPSGTVILTPPNETNAYRISYHSDFISYTLCWIRGCLEMLLLSHAPIPYTVPYILRTRQKKMKDWQSWLFEGKTDLFLDIFLKNKLYSYKNIVN